MKKLRKSSNLTSEDDVAAFWNSHDSCEIVDWSKARPAAFPRLKPSSKTVSLRVPEWMIERYKALARKRDVPYQSLMKISLAEALRKLA